MTMFDQAEIKKYIPQREPFLFVDRIIEFTPMGQGKGTLTLRGDEAVFAGHFPSEPVFPGVLILEHMAQVASFLVAKSNETQIGAGASAPKMVFGMINRARFIAPVIPPAELVTTVTPVKIMSTMGVIDAETRVGDVVVATAKIQYGAIE